MYTKMTNNMRPIYYLFLFAPGCTLICMAAWAVVVSNQFRHEARPTNTFAPNRHSKQKNWIKKPSQEFWSIAPVGCSSPRLPISNQFKIWYQLKQMLKYLNLKTLRIYIRYLGEVRLLTTSCCITELERWGWWRKNEEWAVFLQFGGPALRSYDDSQELSSLQVSEDWRWDGTMKAFSLFLIARSTKWNIVQVWSQEGDWGKWLHQGHGETLLCSRVFF